MMNKSSWGSNCRGLLPTELVFNYIFPRLGQFFDMARRRLQDGDIEGFEEQLIGHYERLHRWEISDPRSRGPKPGGPMLTLFYEEDGVYVEVGRYTTRPSPFYMQLWHAVANNE